MKFRYKGRQIKILPPSDSARRRIIESSRRQNRERNERWSRKMMDAAARPA